MVEDRWRLRGVETLSGFARMGDNRVFAVKGGVIRCSLPGPRPVECQLQPEQLGLCQSLHSALLSNRETGSLE